MEPKRDLAIVLRSIPYQERNRVVTALTENHGRVSALARNSIQSRRFGGTLEPFAASEWLFTERPGADLWSLREAQIRRSYEGLRKDFERLSLASVLSELMLKLAPENEACPDLFRLHSNALAVLEETAEPGVDVSLLNAYLAKLLQWYGSQPQLFACMTCQAPLEQVEQTDPGIPLACIVRDAGWVCHSCRKTQTRHLRERGGESLEGALVQVTPAAIRDFAVCMTLPIRQVLLVIQSPKKTKQELFQLLEALFVYHVPGFDRQPLKALRFLDLESSWQRPEASFR